MVWIDTGVHMMLCHRHARGFALSELIVVLLVVGVLSAVVVALLVPACIMARRASRQVKDSSQVRGITQAMAIWAGNTKGSYPLPSAIDIENATVAAVGPGKDTTANILSVMVFNGSVTTEILVSPYEPSGNIRQCTTYEFTTPKVARVPTKAAWDPALSADFTGGSTGNVSYAHLLPSGPRLSRWTVGSDTTEAVFGNRGPQIASVVKNSDGTVKASVVDSQSNTFLINGGPTTWEGNICCNDGHVDFTTSLREPAAGFVYRDASGKVWADVFFYDEPDDATGDNAFLGIFTKAGPTPADFGAIWD